MIDEDYLELEVNVVRPAAEGWRGEWEYILWTEQGVLLGPGVCAPGPTTPAE